VKRVRLTPTDLADPEVIGAKIDSVLSRSDAYPWLCRKIRRKQRSLHEHLGRDGWLVYLALEEQTNARALLETELLVPWGFLEGVRWARRR
jgi:hypothetical protein